MTETGAFTGTSDFAQSHTMETSALSGYELRIRPTRGWFRIDWRELWEYRDLLFLMVRRDFLARYQQTVLGPLWFILQPLLTTVIFAIVFGGIAKIPTGGLPPILFYFCNQVGWNYFSACFTSTASALSANQHIFSKVYFPRLIVPLGAVASNGFTFIIQFATLIVFYLSYKFAGHGASFGITPAILALPLIVLHLAAIASGLGLWMSALTAKYRDLAQLSALFVQLAMYAAPVIYPLSGVPEKWRWLVALNPVTAPLEALRLAILGSGTVTLSLVATSLAITLVFLITGLAAFSKMERTFVDIA